MGADTIVYVHKDRIGKLEPYQLGVLLQVHGMRWDSFLDAYAVEDFLAAPVMLVDRDRVEEGLTNIREAVDDFLEIVHGKNTVNLTEVCARLDRAVELLGRIAEFLTLYQLVLETGAVFVSDYYPLEERLEIEDRGYVPVTDAVKGGGGE